LCQECGRGLSPRRLRLCRSHAFVLISFFRSETPLIFRHVRGTYSHRRWHRCILDSEAWYSVPKRCISVPHLVSTSRHSMQDEAKRPDKESGYVPLKDASQKIFRKLREGLVGECLMRYTENPPIFGHRPSHNRSSARETYTRFSRSTDSSPSPLFQATNDSQQKLNVRAGQPQGQQRRSASDPRKPVLRRCS
jgi:hypothetical protein